MYNTPLEPGIYWARTSYSKKWNHIIKIKGESPFLNYIGWSLDYPLYTPTEDNDLIGVNPTKFVFGNKINNNYTYSEIWKNKQSLSEMLTGLQKTTKKIIIPNKGLYWAISKSKGDILLIYITGVAPYMSCFMWDILFDTREQNFNSNNLIYLTQIEEPEREED